MTRHILRAIARVYCSHPMRTLRVTALWHPALVREPQAVLHCTRCGRRSAVPCDARFVDDVREHGGGRASESMNPTFLRGMKL